MFIICLHSKLYCSNASIWFTRFIHHSTNQKNGLPNTHLWGNIYTFFCHMDYDELYCVVWVRCCVGENGTTTSLNCKNDLRYFLCHNENIYIHHILYSYTIQAYKNVVHRDNHNTNIIIMIMDIEWMEVFLLIINVCSMCNGYVCVWLCRETNINNKPG